MNLKNDLIDVVEHVKEKAIKLVGQVVLALPLPGTKYENIGDLIDHIDRFHEAVNIITRVVVDDIKQVSSIQAALVQVTKSSMASTKLPSLFNKDKPKDPN